MAKGREGGGLAKKGTKDSLLEELRHVPIQPAAPKEVPPKKSQEQPSVTSPASSVGWEKFVEDNGSIAGVGKDGTKVVFDKESGNLILKRTDGTSEIRPSTFDEVKDMFASPAPAESTPPAEPFDPHSVATAQSLEEQKQSQEMRAHLAGTGVLSAESIRRPDIDISRATVPQYTSGPEVQADLDKLNQGVDNRTDAEKLTEASPAQVAAAPEVSPAASAAPVAEAGESKTIPPELKAIYGDTVPAEKIEMFGKLKGKKKREDYLAKLASDEKEGKERQSKKTTKPRVRKPKPTPVEDIKAQMQREAGMQPTEAERSARMKQMKGLFEQIQDLDRQRDEFFKDGHELSPEERERLKSLYDSERELKWQLNGLIDDVFPREIDPLEIEPFPEEVSALAELAGRLRSREQEVHKERDQFYMNQVSSAEEQTLDQYRQGRDFAIRCGELSHKLREVEDRLGGPQPDAAPAVEKVRAPELVSFGELKQILQEQLEGNPNITGVKELRMDETGEGLQLHIEINTTGGKAVIQGLVKNEGDGLTIADLDVKANMLIRSRVEEAFSGLGAAVKRHFEEFYGQSISKIYGGSTGFLTIKFAPPVTAEPAAEPDERMESTLRSNEEPLDDTSPMPDDTRKGWYDTLRKLIEGATNAFDKAKEFLTSEDTTLAEKAKTLGKGTEKLLLDIGENYRKAPLKQKLALSALLIGGSIATGGAGTFVAVLSAAKLGQRSAGALGVYTLVNGLMEKRLASREEKGIDRKKWDNAIKQFVSGGAALAVFSGIPGLALKEGFEAVGGGRLVGWLGAMLGHHTAAPMEGHPGYETQNSARPGTPHPIPPDREVPTARPDFKAPEVPPPAAVEAAGEAIKEAPTAAVAPTPAATIAETVPSTSVEKTVPSVVAPDIQPQPAAEAVVREAAEGVVVTETEVPAPEPTEPFVAPTGIPDTQPEVPAPIVPDLPKETVASWPPIPKEGLIDLTEAQDAHQRGLDAVATVEEPRPLVETPASEAQPLPVETIVTPDTTVTPVDITNAPEFVSQPHVETPPVSVPEARPLPVETIVSPDTTVTPVDITNAPEFVSQSAVETPSAPLEAPASTPAPVEQAVGTPNKFGLTIPPNETHLYAGANGKDVLVFGGTAQEKARVMLEFFKENPTRIIYSADETGTKRIPWRFIQGQLVPDKPAQEGWLFARTLLKAPSPDDLAKVIK